MTYFKDNSYVRCGYSGQDEGVANRLARHCGWLSAEVHPRTGSNKTSPSLLRELADKSFAFMQTRGFHRCEFCGWDGGDHNYGNGEIWISCNGLTWIVPRLVWHYMDKHRYKLPDELDDALASGDYRLLDSLRDIPFEMIKIPYCEIKAYWDDSRYGNLDELKNAVDIQWPCIDSWHRNGRYGMRVRSMRWDIRTAFEEAADNFPDQIVVRRVVPGQP